MMNLMIKVIMMMKVIIMITRRGDGEGGSKTLIRLPLQKLEISTGYMGHLAFQGIRLALGSFCCSYLVLMYMLPKREMLTLLLWTTAVQIEIANKDAPSFSVWTQIVREFSSQVSESIYLSFSAFH